MPRPARGLLPRTPPRRRSPCSAVRASRRRPRARYRGLTRSRSTFWRSSDSKRRSRTCARRASVWWSRRRESSSRRKSTSGRSTSSWSPTRCWCAGRVCCSTSSSWAAPAHGSKKGWLFRGCMAIFRSTPPTRSALASCSRAAHSIGFASHMTSARHSSPAWLSTWAPRARACSRRSRICTCPCSTQSTASSAASCLTARTGATAGSPASSTRCGCGTSTARSTWYWRTRAAATPFLQRRRSRRRETRATCRRPALADCASNWWTSRQRTRSSY
mmetsp:Transcript_19248/g.59840  ORF Transcript_19248/g.59840 Transcript_19248/m.59840 type:complete len:274 (+) Transcript_19248:764-1585(+)